MPKEGLLSLLLKNIYQWRVIMIEKFEIDKSKRKVEAYKKLMFDMIGAQDLEINEEDMDFLDNLMVQLGPANAKDKERSYIAIFSLSYGLHGTKMTFAKIGEIFNKSLERMRQQKNEGLRSLRRSFGNKIKNQFPEVSFPEENAGLVKLTSLIKDLPFLHCRAYNAMHNCGIEYVWQLVQMKEKELPRTKNFGKKSLKEIEDILKENGLYFGMQLDQKEFPIFPAQHEDDEEDDLF